MSVQFFPLVFVLSVFFIIWDNQRAPRSSSASIFGNSTNGEKVVEVIFGDV